jgi:hypothetical protein
MGKIHFFDNEINRKLKISHCLLATFSYVLLMKIARFREHIASQTVGNAISEFSLYMITQ